MSQHIPVRQVPRIPLLSRAIPLDEYETVLHLLSDLGLNDGRAQETGAAESCLPGFEREEQPFSRVPEVMGRLAPARVFRDY